MNISSVEQAKNILRDYGYSESEVEYALGEGYSKFQEDCEKNEMEISASEYIFMLIRSTPKWDEEEKEFEAKKDSLSPHKEPSKTTSQDDPDDLPF